MFVTESVENIKLFVGQVGMRYGDPTQIDYYRTHPPYGGRIYHHYYPSTISCSVQRTLPTETDYKSEVCLFKTLMVQVWCCNMSISKVQIS